MISWLAEARGGIVAAVAEYDEEAEGGDEDDDGDRQHLLRVCWRCLMMAAAKVMAHGDYR